MKIIVSIETHVYEENHLVDDKILNELLGDDMDSCGVIDPEIIFPIRRNRNPKFLFEYT